MELAEIKKIAIKRLVKPTNWNILNALGKINTKRKLVVIESDDWGSIRVPSKKVFNQLRTLGYSPEVDPYMKYDSLENVSDLEPLFEVLRQYRDYNGNPPVLTANVLVANPNFDKIRASNFSKYFYEQVDDSFRKYQGNDNTFRMWKSGIEQKVFYPQLHGREHLNVSKWMEGLASEDSNLRTAFNFNMISISSQITQLKYGYMESLDFFSKEERESKQHILTQGFNIFEKLLGYRSKSFIANCYLWDESHEKTLADLGVKYIQGIPKQLKPVLKNGNKVYEGIWHYMGEKNKFGQTYFTRNIFFEPSLMKHKSGVVEECLQRMKIAFRWNRPAIIGSHRLNFIGGIDPNNSKENLALFSDLINRMLKRWPDIEFITTDQIITRL